MFAIWTYVQDGLVFRIQVAYHREPQVLRESVTAEGMLIQRDNSEAEALELETQHKPFLTSTLHGYTTHTHTTVVHIDLMITCAPHCCSSLPHKNPW